MASRQFFISTPDKGRMYEEKLCEFTYFSGFSVSQKHKSIASLHSTIREDNPTLNPLEVSTKSTVELGLRLSAFNLKYFDEDKNIDFPLENIFQSSKKFVNGGPYKDLLFVHPRDAKRDERLKESGALISFSLGGVEWELEPKSMFYDWIYIKALNREKILHPLIMEYNGFTDIEFNHQKSYNCQARSVAIFRSLYAIGKIDEYLDDMKLFQSIYGNNETQTKFI